MYVAIVDEGLLEIRDPNLTKELWKDTLTDSGTPANR